MTARGGLILLALAAACAVAMIVTYDAQAYDLSRALGGVALVFALFALRVALLLHRETRR